MVFSSLFQFELCLSSDHGEQCFLLLAFGFWLEFIRGVAAA